MRKELFFYVVFIEMVYTLAYRIFGGGPGQEGWRTESGRYLMLYGFSLGFPILAYFWFSLTSGRGKRFRIAFWRGLDRCFVLWIASTVAATVQAIIRANSLRYTVGDLFLALYVWAMFWMTQQLLQGASIESTRKTVATIGWAMIPLGLAAPPRTPFALPFAALTLGSLTPRGSRRSWTDLGALSAIAVHILMGRRVALVEGVLCLGFLIWQAPLRAKIRAVALFSVASALAFSVFSSEIMRHEGVGRFLYFVRSIRLEKVDAEEVVQTEGEAVYALMDVSSAHRLFEGIRVLLVFQKSGWVTRVFGHGFGAKIDLRGAQGLLSDPNSPDLVRHAIHSLPFAVLHRQGLLGIAAYAYLFFSVLRVRAPSQRLLFLTRAYQFFVVLSFLHALTAYSHMMYSPFLGFVLGILNRFVQEGGKVRRLADRSDPEKSHGHATA